MSQTIEVHVRVRPSSSHGNSNPDSNLHLTIDEEQGKVFVPRPKNKTQAEYTFTKVFGPTTDQRFVYSGCNVINYVLDGINCCIMTYGQTNTGKTYTMYGKGWENNSNELTNTLNKSTNGLAATLNSQKMQDINDNDSVDHDSDNDNDSVAPIYDTIQENSSEALGIIPRCINDLFESLEKKCEKNPSFVYTVSCQILQIYNEKIYDLLTDKKRKNPLPLREFGHNTDGASSVHVRGISVYQIDSKEEAFKLIKKSMKNKAIRSTDFNNVSSRSHTVLQLLVFTEETNQDSIKLVKRSTLSLIDLAGSEKWRSSLSVTSQNNTVNSEIDQQVKEMTNINSSLHVLGNCIAKLIGSDSKHIPYRDSILTRLLQNTLNGNGKSIIIATIHSDDDYMEENWSTLQFASRASRVKVTLQANVGINMNEQSSLQDAQKQIKYLQQQLLELKNSTIYQVPNMSEQQQQQLQLIQQCTTCEENLQRIQELENRMREMDLENKKLKEKIKRMKDQVKNLSQNRQSQESINDTFFQNQQGQGIPPQSYPSSYSVSPVVDSESQQIINASLNSAAQFQQQPLSQQVSGIAYSTNPPGNNSGGYNSQPFAQPGQAPSQAQTVSINLNNLNRSTNNVPIAPVFFAPSKLKTGEKCRKHGLEDCVLCSMFGSSGGGGGGNSGGGGGGGGDGEDEEEVNDEQQSYTLTRPKSEYKPLSSSSRPLTNHDLPVSNFNFTSSSRGFTPKTPLESSNLPHSRQSSGGLLGFLNEDEKNNFGDIPTTSGKKENICRTHSLRNCLLCANELTFQREIQLTNSMEALMKQTTSVLGNNPFQSSSASFHLQNTPTHHQNISSNPTKLAPLGEIPSNQQNNAQFVSTLDSLENSKVDFAFLDTSKQSIHQYTPHYHLSTNMSTTHLQPMQQSFHQQNNNNNNISFSSSIQNKSGFQNSSSFLSQNPPKVSAPPILAPPQQLNVDNYSSNMKNVSPYDAAVAALSAANSLLSSTDFSEAGFPPQEMNNNNGQFKSKRLRELKALSNQPSLGNTTSPAIVETVPSSNPILSGQSINPRRTSTSPAMNNSIPIEPLYIHQQQQQQQQPQQFMNNFQSINPNNHYNQIPRGNNNGFDPNKGIDDGELDEDGEDDIDDGEDYDEDDNHQNYRITSREQTPTEQHRNNHSQMASSSAVKGSALKQPRPSSRTKANNNNLAGDKNGLKKKKLKKKKKKVLIPK